MDPQVSKLRLVAGIGALALVPVLAVADVGPPAHMQVTEKSPGLYAVQWRVPKALPARAVPTPLLPETCRPAGERSVTDQPGAWLLSRDWRCDVGLAGQEIGIRYPFPDLSLTTVIRVDLISGDRFAQVVSPGEGVWLLPEGTAPPDPVVGAQRAVVAGAVHAIGSWIHPGLVLVLSLLGGLAVPVRLVTCFMLGQVAAVTLSAAVGASLPAGPAEIGLAIGVVLLARESLRAPAERRSLEALATAAGLIHGLGLAALLAEDLGAGVGFGPLVVATLGMDAAHLLGVVGCATLLGLAARPPAGKRARTGLAYAAGAAGFALGLSIAFGGQVSSASATASDRVPGQAASPAAAGPAASQRLARSAPDAAIQSFLAVEPFEVRHEVMLRLGGLSTALGLDAGSRLGVEDQPSVADSLVRLVLGRTRLTVDGAAPDPVLRRAHFMTVDPTGALPRTRPVPEDVAEAVLGLVVAYPTGGMPERVRMEWVPFPEIVEELPTTIIDPENTASATLTSSQASVEWENALLEDPIPSVVSVEIEPIRIPIPLLSLPLLIVSVILFVSGLHGRGRAASMALARFVLAAALVVGPVTQTAVAVPGSAGRLPSERQARRILSGLLPNVYRALEFKEEAAIYDRLAVSVTGETLLDVYLEQRRALEIEERGGAQARVETVEVREAGDIERSGDGFSVRGKWTVGGTVTHFGHRHFRQNRYDARVGVEPVEGTWKIRSIEVLEQERIR
jgi:hypothetical protein